GQHIGRRRGVRRRGRGDPMDTVVTALREVTVAELRLAATLHGAGCVRLLRGRGRYDAAVMAHAGELSRRMPDLWEVAEDDGRLSVVHLHVIRAPGGPGYVPGTGWVSPCTADLWAEVATRVHRHAEVPPGVDRYRPSAAVRRHLAGRDGHCRFPACRVPADRCQADHIVGYAEGGPTDPANLHCVCQHHHNLKTWFGWRTRTPDGGVTVVWTAPDGREFTTRARGPLAFLHE
ncbi:HNH endonuclease signature motif containing protein, partial [Corynebacterium bovis]